MDRRIKERVSSDRTQTGVRVLLRCPECGHLLRSRFRATCDRCGAVLVDRHKTKVVEG